MSDFFFFYVLGGTKGSESYLAKVPGVPIKKWVAGQGNQVQFVQSFFVRIRTVGH